MIRLQRGSPPPFWTKEHVCQWTKKWLEKREKGREWKWPYYRNKPVSDYLKSALQSWHFGKCAFCEVPLSGGAQIEHFRSKTHYPMSAFVWRNLFLICMACNQKKGGKNHAGCLKPDRENPADYLWIDPILLKVVPKPGISEVARQRAAKTIQLYALDRPELSALYRVYLERERDRPLIMLADEKRPFTLLITSLLTYQAARWLLTAT